MNISKLRKKLGNIVEGPQCLRMPESIARQIDDLSRTLPKECHYRRKSTTAAAFTFDPGEMADVSYITTDTVDREGEVFLPHGGDWSSYNRVVTWCHAYGPIDGWIGLPVAACLWMKPKSTEQFNGTLAKTRYYAKPADWGDTPWLPAAIVAQQRQTPPGCTGKSIGCIPLNVREATKDELQRRPDWAGKPIFDRWLGLEYAVCPVPMNPACEIEAVAKMLEQFKKPQVTQRITKDAVARLVAERLRDRLARALGMP